MAAYHAEYLCDLAKPSQAIAIPHVFTTGDNESHDFTALVYDSDNPAGGLMAGNVSGAVVLPDGSTVPLTNGVKGELRTLRLSDGKTVQATPCTVTTVQACFAYTGRVKLLIRLIDGETETTVLSAMATVQQGLTATIIDPGDVIEDITTLIADANEAAQTAEQAAEDAQDALAQATNIVSTQPQTLTDSQQTQARENIGAADAAEVSDLKSAIGEKETVTGTFVASIVFSENGTKFIDGGSNGGIYYIQVTAGDSYTINVPTTETRQLRFAFSESVPALNVAGTYLGKQVSTDEDYGTFNYYANDDGYLSISAYNTSTIPVSWYVTSDGLIKEIGLLKKDIKTLQPDATSEDIGKYLKVKSVAGGNVSEYEFGTPSGGSGETYYVNDEYVGNILYRTGIDFYTASQFEKGNISITTNGWTYSDSNTRVRTKNGTTIHLPAGILITLSDYTDARFYLGWLNGNNEYKTQGWVINSGFTTTEEGDYVVLLSNKTEATLSDVNDLLMLLRIYNPSGISNDIQSAIGFLNTFNLFSKNGVVPGYIGSGGSIETTDDNGVVRTDYIAVSPNTTYTIQYWTDTSHDLWCAVAEYNSSKTFLGRLNAITKSNAKYVADTFTTKGTTSYIIVSYRAYWEFAPLMLSGGNLMTAYLPSANDLVALLKESKTKDYITGLKNPLLIPAGPRIVGHRGDMTRAPENTMPAFRIAGQSGAWGIETDIRETSDGYFVCMHEPTVDDMTDGTGTISNLTYAQIQAMTIDAGANIADYPNLKVPTLQEYLSVCRRYGCVAVIEIKSITNYQNFANVIVSCGFGASSVVIAGDEGVIKKVRNVSNLPIIWLYGTGDIDAGIATAKKYYDVWIALSQTSMTAAKISKLHAASIPVDGWTYTTAESCISAIDSGVDIVTTNGIFDLN